MAFGSRPGHTSVGGAPRKTCELQFFEVLAGYRTGAYRRADARYAPTIARARHGSDPLGFDDRAAGWQVYRR
jgi:hypothetical protein